MKRYLSINGVCCGNYRAPGIEGGVNSGFGNGHGLLFHDFVNGDPVSVVHLVELVVSLSITTAAVKPTPEEPRPVVAMAKGAMLRTKRRSCDLAVDGSPTIIMLMSLYDG